MFPDENIHVYASQGKMVDLKSCKNTNFIHYYGLILMGPFTRIKLSMCDIFFIVE